MYIIFQNNFTKIANKVLKYVFVDFLEEARIQLLLSVWVFVLGC